MNIRKEIIKLMKKILLSVSIAIVVICCLVVVVIANNQERGVLTTTNRWDAQARTFNIAGKAVIYDTTNRSNVTVSLANWAEVSRKNYVAELSTLQDK
jgi:outer membrane biogenesis lipoprotein LolB